MIIRTKHATATLGSRFNIVIPAPISTICSLNELPESTTTNLSLLTNTAKNVPISTHKIDVHSVGISPNAFIANDE
ncbi:Uncharacterised protein [Staphylococcus aureus]|nr:Uncharacterised protein [Staphylococcus aureus]